MKRGRGGTKEPGVEANGKMEKVEMQMFKLLSII